MSTIGSFLGALPRDTPYLTPLTVPQIQEDLAAAIRSAARPNERWRKLPAPVTFLLTLLLGAWRYESEPEVFERLRHAWATLVRVTDGALAHARKRLGIAPMRMFFESLCGRGRPAPSFHGLRVHAIDGIRVNLPDTKHNRKRFGRPASATGSPTFPQILLLVMASVTTRCIGGVSLHPCRTGEREPALDLIKERALGAGDLLILDRGFYAAWFLRALEGLGISYLVRMPASVKNLRLQKRRPGWFEIRTVYLREGRRGRRHGRTQTIAIEGRVVAYRVRRQKVRLLTNLPRKILDHEIIEAYHARWEIELLADEIKTHLAASARGTSPLPLRSRRPELIEQEIYGLLSLYNLLRLNMAAAAQRAGVCAAQMSFVNCLRVARRALQRPAPRSLAQLRSASQRLLADMAPCQIDRPRRPRWCPRVVRGAARSFPGKQRHHRSRDFDLKSRLRPARPA